MEMYRATFEGGMDKDTSPELVSQGDYIDAENVFSGYGQVQGGLSTPKGTVATTLAALVGASTVIGAKEDRQTSSLFIFLQNANGAHYIVKWDAKTETAY